MDKMSELTPEKKRLLETEGHILALGGPGSGKTFIALLKAEHEILSGRLIGGQSVLFLSFARSTIARVAQQAGRLIAETEKKFLEINTYHGFAWNILRSHGYLLNGHQKIHLLPPPQAAARLAEFDIEKRETEIRRLFQEEGVLHFDLFASVSRELLERSKSLAQIICDAYPIIILDEFQDTNSEEWQMIQELGKRSTLIALADAEQRIYEFRGADPKRIGDFITTYSPTQFDFGPENNRSNGTDIVDFGNDLLTGANKSKRYKDVFLVRYPPRRGNGLHLDLKTTVLEGCRRLRTVNSSHWSVAVLVPTKRLMLEVSDYLETEQNLSTGRRLPSLVHEVAMDTEGPSLAAVLIAGLLEGDISKDKITKRIIIDLCEYIRGRKGNNPPTQAELKLTGALGAYLESGIIRGENRKNIIEESQSIAATRQQLQLSGDPGEDWLAVRRLLAGSSAESIRQVAEDARYLRFLHKGAMLRSKLSELWRANGNYVGAASAVQAAMLQEHFSASTKEWSGINVMTMHKSKGKEFDEVIVYEGSHQGRIVRATASQRDISQARLALRVAITRAIRRATILTPARDICPFL